MGTVPEEEEALATIILAANNESDGAAFCTPSSVTNNSKAKVNVLPESFKNLRPSMTSNYVEG